MTTYRDEAAAAADGFRIEHDPAGSRFVILDAADQLVGRAHYTLIGESTVNFDGTFVEPSLRGTGLAALLARRAVTSEIATERRRIASCWYIRDYLAAHPELSET